MLCKPMTNYRSLRNFGIFAALSCTISGTHLCVPYNLSTESYVNRVGLIYARLLGGAALPGAGLRNAYMGSLH